MTENEETIKSLAENSPPISQEHMEDVDKEKRASGKSPERVINETNLPFEIVFGLSADMKVIKKLLELDNNSEDSAKWEFCDLCISMAEEYYRLRKLSPDKDPREVQKEVLIQFATDKFPKIDTELVMASFEQERDDEILDIGSPYAKLASLLGRRVTTIDYEYREDTENNELRTTSQASGRLVDRAYSHSCTELLQNPETPEALKPILDSSYGSNEGREKRPRGMRQVFDGLEELRTLHDEGYLTTDEILPMVREAVRDLANLRAQAALITPHARVKSPFRDPVVSEVDINEPEKLFEFRDTLSYIMREIFYINQSVHDLELFSLYENQVLPRALYEHIEEIMDAIFENGMDNLDYRIRDILQREIQELGFDPATYSPTAPGARPFDILINMLKHQTSSLTYTTGPNLLRFLDQGDGRMNALAESLQSSITEEMSRLNPIKPRGIEEGNKRHRMMFPFTQSLPDHSFDRVLASWSFSVRMLPEMTNDQITNEIWPELFRLLSSEGIAVIFPIGFYDNDNIAYESHISTEDRLEATLNEYNSKVPPEQRLIFQFHDSPDPRIEAGSVLVISRKDIGNFNHYNIGN